MNRSVRRAARGLLADARDRVMRRRRERLLTAALDAGLPRQLEPPLYFLVTRRLDEEDRVRCDAVERLRDQLAARAGETVSIYYSPKPGTAGAVATAEMRPQHGEVQQFDLERVARQTSVGREAGRFMYLVARSTRARTILELGACAGIASSYLASSGCDRFVGVEGSPELAAIARSNVQQIKPDAEIVAALFDDALDELNWPDGIDAVWIDGHHEKVATLHYFQRLQPHLNPGAFVFFDDIRWSHDMFDMWQEVQQADGLAHTVDLGGIGLGIWGGQGARPRHWDLSDLRGRPEIGTPAGWA
jgi:predicted O-methyltransferase YrrM